MARPGITYQNVADAAVQLQGQGKRPTVDGILTLLGSGSKSTIVAHLQQWRVQQGELPEALLQALPRHLLASVLGLWQQMNQTTDERLEVHLQESQTEIQTLKTAFSQVQRELQSTQAHFHQEEEKNAALHQEKDNLETRLRQSQQNHHQLQERHDGLNTQLEAAQAENKRLHTLANHIQENLQHYQEAMQVQRTQEALASEKQQLVALQERKQLEQQLASDQKRAYALEMELKIKISQLDSYGRLQTDYDACLQKIETLTRDYTILTTRYEQQEKISLQQSTELEKAYVTTKELEKQLAMFGERTQTLEKQLQYAKDKIEALRHEKEFLIQEKAELKALVKAEHITG